jgi:hypothetical protein
MTQFMTPPGPRYSKRAVQTRGLELALRAGFAAFLSGSAHLDAQELSSAPVPASPSSVYASQADSATLTPICTDRPSKSNYACTVDAGHFQYESDLANASSLRQDDYATTTWLFFNPTLKYGLTANVDVEANMTALEILRTKDTTGMRTTLMGVSDLYVRVKYEFLNLPNVVQVAIIPYVKAPTGRAGIGDRTFDAGWLLPINYEPNSLLTLTLMPEVDAYPNSVGAGRHLNTAEVFTLAFNLPRHLTLYTELWADWNLDPDRTIRQRSADLALAYSLTDYLQVDGGVNRGLNAATPRVQGYLGLSQKF